MLVIHRNAVLPQFMTWETQVGIDASRLGFRVQARFTATVAIDSLIVQA